MEPPEIILVGLMALSFGICAVPFFITYMSLLIGWIQIGLWGLIDCLYCYLVTIWCCVASWYFGKILWSSTLGKELLNFASEFSLNGFGQNGNEKTSEIFLSNGRSSSSIGNPSLTLIPDPQLRQQKYMILQHKPSRQTMSEIRIRETPSRVRLWSCGDGDIGQEKCDYFCSW